MYIYIQANKYIYFPRRLYIRSKHKEMKEGRLEIYSDLSFFIFSFFHMHLRYSTIYTRYINKYNSIYVSIYIHICMHVWMYVNIIITLRKNCPFAINQSIDFPSIYLYKHVYFHPSILFFPYPSSFYSYALYFFLHQISFFCKKHWLSGYTPLIIILLNIYFILFFLKQSAIDIFRFGLL